MKKRQLIIRIAGMLGLYLLAACCPYLSPSAEESPMAEKSVINPGFFGDPQNNSSLPVTGSISGRELFFAKAEDIGQSLNPLALSLVDGRLVVWYGGKYICLDSENGDLIWTRTTRGNHLYRVDTNGILTLDHSGQYVPIDLDNKPGDQTYLPSVHEDAFLHFSTVLDNGDWAYLAEQYPEPMSSPDEDPEPPETRFVRYNPEQMDVRWEHSLPPEPRGVAVTKDGSVLYVAFGNSLHIIPINATGEDEVITIDMNDVISLSTDGNGNALIGELVDNVAWLRQVLPDGETGWSVSLGSSELSRQPAAGTGDGEVFVVAGGRVLKIADGKITWEYPLKANTGEIRISILSDKSVLVAAGVLLVHISPAGKELFSKWFDHMITTRPIMDASGKVYYGADNGIHCLE